MTVMASSGSMKAMPSPTVSPQMSVRVPENVQNLGRARAAQLNMKFGQYIAQLIIKDSTELARLFMAESEIESQDTPGDD